MKNRTSYKLKLSTEQAEALQRVADARRISKGALIREGIALLTGTPDSLARYPSSRIHPGGIPAYNARRKAEAEARREAAEKTT
jgi:hypothetical protein